MLFYFSNVLLLRYYFQSFGGIFCFQTPSQRLKHDYHWLGLSEKEWSDEVASQDWVLFKTWNLEVEHCTALGYFPASLSPNK